MKLTDTYEWNHVHSTDILSLETTSDYLRQLQKDDLNIQTAENLLNALNIQVKTKYGNYLPTYNILKNIGERWNQFVDKIELKGDKL